MSEDQRAVLLVEDNADDAEVTIRGLKRANLHHPIDVARDDQEALDSLFGTDEQPPRRVPAVVLLDLKLPRVDGLDVLKRIRGEERTERIPVVMLISSSEDGDLIHAYDLGANSYPASGVGLPPAYNHGTLALLALAGLAVAIAGARTSHLGRLLQNHDGATRRIAERTCADQSRYSPARAPKPAPRHLRGASRRAPSPSSGPPTRSSAFS